MHRFIRALGAATVVTLSTLAAAGQAHAVGFGDIITIKSSDGSVVTCTPFGCIQTTPPCQCSPKGFDRVATPPKNSTPTPTRALGK